MCSKPSPRGALGVGAEGSLLNVCEVHLERDPHLHGVLARGLELGAGYAVLERLAVGELELRVVREVRVAEGIAEHLAVPERRSRHAVGDLHVLGVPIGIGLTLVDDEHADHGTSSSLAAGRAGAYSTASGTSSKRSTSTSPRSVS